MKVNKSLFVLSSILLLSSLVACQTGGNSNKQNGAKSDKTAGSSLNSNVSQTSASAESQVSEESFVPTKTLEALNVILYEKFVSSANAASLKTAFESYLKQNGIAITNLVWDVSVTGNVASLNTYISTYNSEHETTKYDVILGGKAFADCDYLNNNYSVVKNGEAFVEITIGEKNDRRIWLLNDSANIEAAKLLVKSIANFDIDDQGQNPKPETSGEPSTSSETSAGGDPSTSGAVSQNEFDELNVYLYHKFITEDQSTALRTQFENFLLANGKTIKTLNWVLSETTGAVAELDAELKAYDEAHPNAVIDVILGGKAISTTYVPENFTHSNGINMTIGDKDDRYIWTRKTSENSAAIELLLTVTWTAVE